MDWFAEWVDTPYYHILYKNRDDSEAQNFIDNLLKYLQLPKSNKILDLACGKGRHSIYLNKLGYEVTGLDLSSHSIKTAKKMENEHLKFVVGDMRSVYFPNEFDAVFNLFTSFGYFNDENDNLKVYQSVYEQLKPNGVFVMDFMNASLVEHNLIPYEEKEVDGIRFFIRKKIDNNVIVKDIKFTDQGRDFHYQERVNICKLWYFKDLAEKAQLKFRAVFGDYQLNEFDEKNSARLILIFQK